MRPTNQHDDEARRVGSHRERDAESMALFREYRRTLDPATRNALVERFGHVALTAAYRLRHRGEALEDLEQVARFGLIKAVERFDPGRGFAFSTFAYPTVMGELRRHFRDTGWAVHVPRSVKERTQLLTAATERLTHQLHRRPTVTELAVETGSSEDEVLEAMDAREAYRTHPLTVGVDDGAQFERGAPPPCRDELIETTTRMELAGHLRRLPRRQQRIIALRFFTGRTQREIADEVGLSQVQVSRLIRVALAELRSSYEQAADDELGMAEHRTACGARVRETQV